MERRIALAAILAGILTGSCVAGVARGQVPDGPALPEVPEVPAPPPAPDDAQPMLEAVAPATRTVCQVVGFAPATMSSAASLAALALSIARLPTVAVPREVHTYLDLTRLPCASLPQPGTISECGVDRSADAATDEVFAATGAGLVVVFVPVPVPSTGPVLDTAVAVEELLAEQGVEVPGEPAATTYGSLGCSDVLAGVGGELDDPVLPVASGMPVETDPPAPARPAPGARTSVRAEPPPGVAPVEIVDGAGTTEAALAPTGPVHTGATTAPVVAAADPWSPWRVGGIAAVMLGLGGLWFVHDASRRRLDTRG